MTIDEMATQSIACSVTRIPSPTTRRPFFLSRAANLPPDTQPPLNSPPISISFPSCPPLLLLRRRQPSSTVLAVTDDVPTRLNPFSSDDHHHHHHSLRDLLHSLESDGASPLLILTQHGDWPSPHFWAVIKFLQLSSQSHLILQVFDAWKALDKSRISESNYEQIIELLSEEGQTGDAISAMVDMKGLQLNPSINVYNSIIHGLAKAGSFDQALAYLDEMKQVNLSPNSQTFDGLIAGYGAHGRYDEIGTCMKRMALERCQPTAITYNLLVTEYAKAGLLTRMETTYQIMRSKKMDLQPRTLLGMLEAYANYGIVEKADKVLNKVRRSRLFLKEALVRKLAAVYIENRMFSRLDELGNYLASSSSSRRSDIVWLLHLLSHACVASRKAVDSTLGLMEELNVGCNVTVVNLVLLMYLKMKDFTRLRSLLLEMEDRGVKPDIITVGIVFDAAEMGFHGRERVVEKWRKMGLLRRGVEMATDPLVSAAFGKGKFVRSCEDMYLLLDSEERKRKKWTYSHLIDSVARADQCPTCSSSVE